MGNSCERIAVKGKVDFAWRSAVGTAMARVSNVRLEGSVLLVEAQTKQWAAAIMRSTPLILRRLQPMLGADTAGPLSLPQPNASSAASARAPCLLRVCMMSSRVAGERIFAS